MTNTVIQTREEAILEEKIYPKSTVDLPVGMYESAMPLPCLRLEFDPHHDQNISSQLVRMDGLGEYTLILRVTNAARSACTLKVWSSWQVA